MTESVLSKIRKNYEGIDFQVILRAKLLFWINLLLIGAHLLIFFSNMMTIRFTYFPVYALELNLRLIAVSVLLISTFLLAFAQFRKALTITMVLQFVISVQPLLVNSFASRECLTVYSYHVILNLLLLVLFTRRPVWLVGYAFLSVGMLFGAWKTVSTNIAYGSYSYSNTKAILTVVMALLIFSFLAIAIQRVFRRIIYSQTLSNDYLEHLAYTDMITYRLNYYGFLDELSRMMAAMKSDNDRIVLIGFEISNFSVLNKGYGFETGNTLLRKFVERVDCVMPKDGIWGRISGSTFIFAYRDKTVDFDHQGRLIEAAHETLREPFVIRGTKYFLSANAVLTIFPDDAHTETQLINNILNLLITAKDDRSGIGSSLIRFNEKSYHQIRRKLKIDEYIEHAITSGELHVSYQPKISLHTGRIAGVEALCRWESAKLGKVSPSEFIPVIEKSRLIELHSEFMLRKVNEESVIVERETGMKMRYAVNLSSYLIYNGWIADFISANRNIVKPETVEFEITESIFLGNESDVMEKILGLRNEGYVLSIDDFGTGYSNLRYLHQFNVQYLKVDREFVLKMKEKEENIEIIRAIISMAKSLGIGTIAEGVEYEDQVRILKEAGCEYVQGYYFSKPLSFDDLILYIKKNIEMPEKV